MSAPARALPLSPDAVLFDLDGVLVDSRRAFANSVNAALEGNGLQRLPDADLHRDIGPPIQLTLERLTERQASPELAAGCLASFRERYVRMSASESEVFAGIPEALSALHGRVPLSVATSKAQPMAVDLLESLGLARFFDAIVGTRLDEAHESKDITLARALEGVHAEAPVLIGDTRFDALAARANGIDCVGALWGIGSEQDLVELGVVATVESPHGLPALLFGS